MAYTYRNMAIISCLLLCMFISVDCLSRQTRNTDSKSSSPTSSNMTSNTTGPIESMNQGLTSGQVIGIVIAVIVIVIIAVVAILILLRIKRQRSADIERDTKIQMATSKHAGVYPDLSVNEEDVKDIKETDRLKSEEN